MHTGCGTGRDTEWLEGELVLRLHITVLRELLQVRGDGRILWWWKGAWRFSTGVNHGGKRRLSFLYVLAARIMTIT